MTRLRTGEMFVNLARRGQGLAGRLTTAIDELERPEEDPRRLKQLFQVDLLVTLLSRVNDSLLVLGGNASAQVRLADEPLSSVIKAAGSRVEKYQQWETGWVDDGVAVRAGVVDDVVLLLALLVDNAVRYSQRQVMVDARLLHDRVVFQIVDEGVGIEPDKRAELNRRLASRPSLDVQAVRWMGVTVAALLAQRHGIRVELRESRPQGTIAEVTLPIGLVTVQRPVTPRALPSPRPAPAVEAATAAVPAAGPAMAWPPAPTAAAGGDPLTGNRAWEVAATQELRLPIYDEVRRSLWFDPPARGEADDGGRAGTATSWAHPRTRRGRRRPDRLNPPRTGLPAAVCQGDAAARSWCPAGSRSSGLAARLPRRWQNRPGQRGATRRERALVAAAYARGLAGRRTRRATGGDAVPARADREDVMRERMR